VPSTGNRRIALEQELQSFDLSFVGRSVDRCSQEPYGQTTDFQETVEREMSQQAKMTKLWLD